MMANDTSESAKAAKLAALRVALPATSETVYLNSGTNGPHSRALLDATVAKLTSDFELGRIGSDFYPSVMQEAAEIRTMLASIMGCDADEVALTRNAIEGMNIGVMGINWRPGDELVTTQLEHVCLFNLIGLAAHRHGITVRTVDIGNGDGDVTARLMAACTSRTRAVVTSHVQWSTGAVLDMTDLAGACRERGILTIIDGAQSGGHVPMDMHAFGVDIYAIPGQKWLCGPVGTGAVYVRRESMGDVLPTYLRGGSFDVNGFVVPSPGASRYETAEVNPLTGAGFRAGLQWIVDEVGLDWAYDRIRQLGERCYDGLATIPGIHLVTPRGQKAGLICFQIDGMTPQELTATLAERGYTIRYVEQKPSPLVARISCGWWLTEDEVDGVVDEIALIVAANAA
ncbi:MAG: aminotransferase class V-fold PLP-dependent enzyme [Thermomicrobiales bacterium]|nr:aminotransferase class V-fold PLP-dependent enzyme [Thermomicrobiales bacterium]